MEKKISIDDRKLLTAPVNWLCSTAAAVHEQKLEGNAIYSAVGA